MTTITVDKKNGRLSVREQTYRLIKKKILTGLFPPDERLVEESLAGQLGVSRTPVREALHKLELEGLVRQKGARGFCVPEETAAEMSELFEIRAVLEGHALSCLCNSISEDSVRMLREYISKAEHGVSEGRIELVFESNTKFHDLIYRLVRSKRPRLFNLIEDMRDYILRYRKDSLATLQAAGRSISGHKKILLALELNDPVLCEQVMRAHIYEAEADAAYSPHPGKARV
ncbi:MAG: GntR family transcriptional regulator [Desulfocapsaceae bacterium]|jgi:DNA-binding GntR family transcriptional regulator|nr:GntR family transcriptional regulator [Desulfocapsaceae bacterium]